MLVIVGPTASGKSALAVRLAQRFGGEVISADSRQVYKGLTIGTGKITPREMEGVRHHLLDIASPKRTFTAADFARTARRVLQGIAQRGKIPIIAGGSGFYIDVLLGRITLPNVPPNRALRNMLEKKSIATLFALLKKKDPHRAQSIEQHNKRRLIRALEIAEASPKASVMENEPQSFDVLWVGIKPNEAQLRINIEMRLRERLKKGMVAEARRLHASGLSYKRMRELGLEYRALADFLDGRISREILEHSLARNIKRYAKRQITYWKRNRAICWFTPRQERNIETAVRAWLKR